MSLIGVVVLVLLVIWEAVVVWSLHGLFVMHRDEQEQRRIDRARQLGRRRR